MAPHVLLVLALIVSLGTAALAWALGAAVERFNADARLRDAVWGTALGLSALPLIVIGLVLLTPPHVREITLPVTTLAEAATVSLTATPTATGTAPPLRIEDLAWLGVGLAAGLALVRLGSLVLRIVRLARLIAGAAPADPALDLRVRTIAAEMGTTAPMTVVSAQVSEAMLANVGRLRLILPTTFGTGPQADAVLAHEMAHLKRGDHQTLWLEEALAILLAFNPLFPLLRARRDAAREEVCDALALAQAEPATRRAYAQTLIKALRDRTCPQTPGDTLVALTFTGAGRTSAMHRLKAVITPVAPASLRTRLTVMVAGAALLVAATGATSALAGHRAVETRIVSSPPSTSTSRGAEILHVQVRQQMPTPFIIGSGDKLRLTLKGQDDANGARYESRMETDFAPGQSVERVAAFTLEDDQLPTLTQGRVYQLTADILSTNGRVFYAAEPVTVRLAPGSRGRIADMRPELTLAPVSDR